MAVSGVSSRQWRVNSSFKALLMDRVRPFSIIIPSHNRPDLLHLCLESVSRYAPVGTEVIVVDDASAGSSVSRVAASFPGTIMVRLPRRKGFCIAANAGIRVARGEIVELLNDDAEVTAGWAEKAVPHFQKSEVAAVAPLVLFRRQDVSGRVASNGCWQPPWSTTHQSTLTTHSPLRIDSAGDRYYVGGVAGKRGHGESLRPKYQQSCRVFGASACAAFFRKEVLLRVGAFPENFRAYFEDVDLAFRLNRAGFQIVYEPASVVYHSGSASHGPRRRQLLEQQSQNEERVFWRNLPAGVLARSLPRHVGVLAAKAWRRWQEGALIPFLCGRLRLLGEVPALIRHRRQLQVLTSSFETNDWQIESRYWGRPTLRFLLDNVRTKSLAGAGRHVRHL
jgi:GT2 family glycosyltransferase